MAQISMGAPVQVCTAALSSSPAVPSADHHRSLATAKNVQANRTISQTAPSAQFPQFSSEPTDAEISRARVFEEPLLPTAQQQDTAENLALAGAISAYLHKASNDDVSAITQFLSAYPTSRWRASILLNLGILYRWTGYFSKAVESWNEAWNLLKTETQPQLKASADRALAELMELNARVGRYEILEPLLEQIQGREIRGSATEKISGVKQGFWMMKNKPEEAFLCGPLALSNLFAATHSPTELPPTVLREAQSSVNGFSLSQLQTLASRAGMEFRMAKRHQGACVPVPCLVNWKIGHYAALVKEDRGRYLVKDPTFAYDIWISAAALDAECSGYFLIPAGDLPTGWESVPDGEGSRIWGKGNAGLGDPNHDTSNDKKCKDDDCDQGMAHYNFHALVMSLNIVDTPVGYTPPRGPSMKFKVTYNQREANQPANLMFSNLGQKWTYDWLSYVKDPGNSTSNVTVVLSGGGAELYLYNGTTYAVQRDSQTTLTRFTSPSLYYERQYPNGSKDVYAFSDGASPPNIFLTQRIDPAGNAITFNYDTTTRRLTSVTDALGQSTTITHLSDQNTGPDYYLIWKVTDPFGRFAQFDYTTSTPRQLNKITDVVGITSQFGYQTGTDFINTMTTPYDTTTFSYGESGYRRWLDATDPTGTEHAEFNSNNDFNDVPDSESPTVVPTGLMVWNQWLKYRNTYYWDKKTMELFPPDPNLGTNYTKARIWHWVHGYYGGNLYSSNILESEKRPLENRVWYNYPGQTASYADWGVTLSSPSKVARVVGNGSTQLRQYSYNSIGKVTQVTDPQPSPSPRVTSYVYDTNNVDLLQVYQRNPNGHQIDPDGQPADLIEQHTYNAKHEPLSSTDWAIGTTFTYDTNGQILTRANGDGTTTFGYGDGSPGHPSGYLTSITSPPVNNASAVLSFSYDAFNRINMVTDSDGYTVTTTYDNLDRPTLISYPDTTTKQFQYTQDFGQGLVPILDLTTSIDRRGLVTTRHYDSNRHMDWIADPLGHKTRFGWCGCGELASITDPVLNHTTTFNRDIEGRVYQKLFADGTAINYLYDGQTAAQGVGATSRLQSSTDAKSQRTNYTYFLDDNVQQITYTDTNGQPLVPPTPSVSFTYDSNYNRVLTMTDGSGPTVYGYYPITDPVIPGSGRLASINGPLANDTIVFGYDSVGRINTRSINGGNNSETWVFDSLGRVTTDTNKLGMFTYGYVGVTNRLDTLTYPPNNQTAHYSYFDNLGDKRLQQILNRTSTSALISQFDYTYDHEGQVLTWKKNYPGLSPAPQRYDLTYDNADQLKRAPLKNDATNALITNYLYDYDWANNRTSETVGTTNTTSTPNLVNEITSQSGGTNRNLTYDFNGSLVNDGLTRTFEWDGANRLVAINTGTTNRSEFTYDGLSRCAKIVEKTNGSVTSTRKFVWCGNDMCEFRDTNDAVTLFVYPQGQYSGTKYFYTRDHLGSIREMFKTNDIVVARYDYDPWGRSTTKVSTVLPDFNFTGLYRHGPSNLVMAVHRFYDPDLGRWISRDPLGELSFEITRSQRMVSMMPAEVTQGANLYAYVRNQPVSKTDPLGLEMPTWEGKCTPAGCPPGEHLALNWDCFNRNWGTFNGGNWGGLAEGGTGVVTTVWAASRVPGAAFAGAAGGVIGVWAGGTAIGSALGCLECVSD